MGLSLATPLVGGRRQFADAPKTKATEALATCMAARAGKAGIEIVLIDGQGRVEIVT